VAPGSAAILATTENFSDGWNARLNGKKLSPVRLDGWRQGWMLPSGAGGAVRLTFEPGATYRVALIVGLGAVVAVAGLALRRRRSSPELPPCPAAPIPWWLAFTFAAVAAFLCGGWAVLVVVPLILLLRSWLPLAGAASVILAIGIAAGQHGAAPGSGIGTFGSAVQLLTVFALAAVILSAAAAGRPGPDET
jgi:arabinofuranan 3-O-arabinosyltransferase